LRAFISKVDSRMAEFLGMLIGDGCISRFISQGRVKFEVAFTGNLSEFDYYNDFLKPVVEGLFPVKGRLLVRDDNTVRLHFRSKRLAMYFLSLGLPLGKKKDASIPLRVTGRRLLVAFIRGFYHAEGSIYRRYSKKYPYHSRKYDRYQVVQFRCTLRTLMMQLHNGIKALGIVPTRLSEKGGVYTFRITNQAEIRKFMHIIRPRYKKSPKAE
jgi:hypothetical protein